MDGHHLILGKLTDFITGEILNDTHDERYRQKLAHLLVENKGYAKTDIIPRCELLVAAGKDKRALIKVDFKVTLSGRACMIIKYGPGSLVTRQRPSLAASRLMESYQIPFVVVTNGESADILAGDSGKVISSGLDAIPSRTELGDMTANAPFGSISSLRTEMESRILYAYEVDGCCPCDDSVCRL
ncbi:MAG: type I restriction enzyme HsdR N-terminal domain-containing protein [Desulfobacterales bacterium]|nr:type I restriction enzyme HsdR N-terminal domain-containing protein [Desulfobacterales bacterium]